jgi:hypothetical protein
LFKGDYKFVIPNYQRPYAWTDTEAEELFDDLLDACRNQQRDAEGTYFLGSVVLIKQERDPVSQVVDGQQRLTSLTILFAALRTTTPERADVITEYLYKKADPDLPDETDDYRLTVRDEDAAFFRGNILQEGALERFVQTGHRLRDSQLRFRENAALYVRRLRELDMAERMQLRAYMDSQCSLVVITTPNLDSAYRIFSVLNDRGLDLAPIDILKAEVLGAIRKAHGETRSEVYARKWGQIETTLGRDGFSALLTHVRMIFARQKQRGSLLQEFREALKPIQKPIELVDEELIPYAGVWAQVKDAEFSSVSQADEINGKLSWLNRIGFADWVPPALAFIRKFKDHPTAVNVFLEDLERLSFYLLVTKKGINDRIETYAKVTEEALNADIATSTGRLNGCALTPKQAEAFEQALNGNIYEALPRGRATLLLRLEGVLSDGSKVFTTKNLSIEHVLPQSPATDSQWLRTFPNKEERETWTHRLANLVPLDARKNPAAANFDYPIKKDVYFFRDGKASPFILTNELRSMSGWTPAVLEDRQTRLLQALKKHWRL